MKLTLPRYCVKQITKESMEWQAMRGLSQDRDLGARKMKDYSFSATASYSIGLAACGSTGCTWGHWTTPCRANSTLALGVDWRLCPTHVGCAPVCHAELQTRVCGKCTSETNQCCALSPQGWWTHGWFRGELPHWELSALERNTFCQALLL